MPKTKLPKEKIQQDAVAVKLTGADRKIFDIATADAPQDGHKKNPYVALKYFQESWECFSTWEKNELKLFSDFIKKLSGHTWQQVHETAGKTNKHGLAYTTYEISQIKGPAKSHLDKIKNLLSEDITFFELRVDQGKLRVHGFRAQSAFFLVLLDRGHAVIPS